MENKTTFNAQFTITPRTKLGEVLEMLDLGEKPAKTPSVKALYEESAPIAEMNGCALFRNGFVVYANRSGRTVIWLPCCTHFTYHFNKLRDAEKDLLTIGMVQEMFIERENDDYDGWTQIATQHDMDVW